MSKWAEVSVQTTQEAMEAVANLLHEVGAGGVVIEDAQDLQRTVWHHQTTDEEYLVELDPQDFPEEGVVVKAYFPDNSDLIETVNEIKRSLRHLRSLDIDLGPGTVTLNMVNEEDWAHAWKKYYKPVRISERITITPSWEPYTPQTEDELVIKLDPGMAFGTGTHPTTMLCIRALERYVRPQDQVIDVGCGSGVLSIAAAKLGAAHVLALDIDEVAVRVSEENVALNQVKQTVKVQKNNLLENIRFAADIVICNILAEVIVRCSAQAHKLLKAGGFFIASGIIKNKEQMVHETLISQGFAIVETDNMEDWLVIVAQKV